MPITLGPDEPDEVAMLLDCAVADVDRARDAAADGRLTARHVEDLALASAWLDSLMARYTDGDGYGALPDELMEDLEDYSDLAAEIMEEVMPAPLTTQSKIRPGRYVLTRTLADLQPPIESSIECNNPAFGLHHLDMWEQAVRAAISANQKHRASSKTAKAA